MEIVGDHFHHVVALLMKPRVSRRTISFSVYLLTTGVTEPETKRKIIGKNFIDAFERAIQNSSLPIERTYLLQGTLYPDVIESTSFKGPSSVIKSHHNVGGLPER